MKKRKKKQDDDDDVCFFVKHHHANHCVTNSQQLQGYSYSSNVNNE